MKKQTIPGVLIILTLGTSAVSFAEESTAIVTPNISTSTAPTPSMDDVLNNMYVSYFGIYHGSPLKNPGISYTPGANGTINSHSQSMNFDSTVVAAYKITPSIGVGAYIPFLAVPVMGQGIILGDLGVTLYDGKTIDSHGLLVYTNFILQGPTSKNSQLNGMQAAYKTTPYVIYHFARTRFTVGSWNEMKEYGGVNNTPGNKTFKLYAAPWVGYTLTSKFALNLEYEMEWHHNVGDSFGGLSTYQTDLMPGFVWNITPKILVNPYIQFFNTGNMSLDTAAIGAVISATVL